MRTMDFGLQIRIAISALNPSSLFKKILPSVTASDIRLRLRAAEVWALDLGSGTELIDFLFRLPALKEYLDKN